MNRKTQGYIANAQGVTIVVALGGVLGMVDEIPEAESASRLIDEVRPNQVQNEVILPPDAPLMLELGVTVSAPSFADGMLKLTGESAAELGVVLLGAGFKVFVTSDGEVVYGEENRLTVAVQSGDGDARIHTVMGDSDAVEDVTYIFPGLSPELNEDGSVTLVQEAEGGTSRSSVRDQSAGEVTSRSVVSKEIWAEEAKGISESCTSAPCSVDGDGEVRGVPMAEPVQFHRTFNWGPTTLNRKLILDFTKRAK